MDFEDFERYCKSCRFIYEAESTKEQQIKYQIGLIDFLQMWNYKKILEKYGKKILKVDAGLDTSAQDPAAYSKRFCLFLEKILFCEDR